MTDESMSGSVADDLLSVGEVAAATGLAVSAIRYYDELGLISTVTRIGGKRRFDRSVIGTVSFVTRAQEAGFTLREIGDILDDTAGEWNAMVKAKVMELMARRDRLDVVIGLLNEVRTCGCEVVAECPRIVPSESTV